MRRIGQVIGLKPDQVEAYERLHAAAWPEVLATIHDCNIRNYSIFRHGELLFAYFEYVGDNYETDMAKMAADPQDTRVVDLDRAHAGALGNAGTRRMVDHDERSLSRRLATQERLKEIPMFRLDKKIAFVTGAGSGIGEHIARLFAQQGAHVILTDIRPDTVERIASEIQAARGSARSQQLDVADEYQVKAAMERVAATEGRLDILVNNAGISHVGTILETGLEDWERVMRVNAGGIFLCAREGVRQMLAQSPAGGVIINMSSVAATIGIERRLSYSASKGAVLALTRSIAIDFVTQGIRCNAICPGTVHTPFVEGYLARNFAGHEDEVRQQLHARQPIGRMGRPDEIAYAALYLASDEAAFVTGSALVIDGGWTAK
jgi:2-keto-3-deoxy-L-fuconate dehydrogenase